MADRTESVILEFEVDEGQSVESINKLIAANKELRKERNELNIATESGKKRAQEINAQIDANTKKVVANSSALEKQKANIGNYTSATTKTNTILEQMTGKLGAIHPALGQAANGMKSMTTGIWRAVKASLAFIATPIGVVLAAVGVALAAVVKYLTGSEEGMDKFAKVSAQAGAILNVLFGTLRELGGALVDIFSGDFTKGIERAAGAFDGMATEMANAATEAGNLADIFDTLEELQLRQKIRNDEESNQIKNLIIQSKNRSLTEKERFDLLDKAAQLEKKITGENLALKLAEINATTKQLLLDEGRLDLEQKVGETTIDFAKRIAKDESLLYANRTKIGDQLGEYNALLDSQRNVQEKIGNQQDALAEKEAANREKQIELIKKQKEEQEKLNAEVDAYIKKVLESIEAPKRAREAEAKAQEERTKLGQDFIKQTTDIGNASLDLTKRIEKDQEKINTKQVDDARETGKKKIEIDRMVADAVLSTASNVAGTVAGLVEEGSTAYKVAASLQTLISTYSSAQKSYESLAAIPYVGPALGFAAAAAAVAAGLANVAKINGVEFAEGGWTGPGDKWKPAGVVHADEYVVPKHIVNNPAAAHHVSALEQMRLRPYADGGFVANSVSNPINQQMEIGNILKNLGPFEVSVKEVTRVQNRVKVKQQISKR